MSSPVWLRVVAPSSRLPSTALLGNGEAEALSLAKELGILDVLITVIFAAILGLAGNRGLLNWMSADFRDMATLNFWRPRRFMTVYGIHLGGYVGGMTGALYGIWSIFSERKRLQNSLVAC